jgi:hypothetical protein
LDCLLLTLVEQIIQFDGRDVKRELSVITHISRGQEEMMWER